MLAKCDCENDFQDRMYGKGVRVHNKMKGDIKHGRCVVCGKDRNI